METTHAHLEQNPDLPGCDESATHPEDKVLLSGASFPNNPPRDFNDQNNDAGECLQKENIGRSASPNNPSMEIAHEMKKSGLSSGDSKSTQEQMPISKKETSLDQVMEAPRSPVTVESGASQGQLLLSKQETSLDQEMEMPHSLVSRESENMEHQPLVPKKVLSLEEITPTPLSLVRVEEEGLQNQHLISEKESSVEQVMLAPHSLVSRDGERMEDQSQIDHVETSPEQTMHAPHSLVISDAIVPYQRNVPAAKRDERQLTRRRRSSTRHSNRHRCSRKNSKISLGSLRRATRKKLLFKIFWITTALVCVSFSVLPVLFIEFIWDKMNSSEYWGLTVLAMLLFVLLLMLHRCVFEASVDDEDQTMASIWRKRYCRMGNRCAKAQKRDSKT